MTLAAAAGACAQQRAFNLPAEDAVNAIPEFARQAGLQIVAPADQLKGVKTPAIMGRQDARAALRLLLAGTGLTIAADNGAVITLRSGNPPNTQRDSSPPPENKAAVQSPSRRGDAIEQVVVTATKTGATDLQKTPVSIAVLSGAELRNQKDTNIKDLPQLVPSLKVTINSINPQIMIRGVGGFSGQESEVSVYMDNVYIARISTVLQSNFNDLDRIEVIEGPQGTVFGRNSTGGAINFISKTPTDHLIFNDTVLVGNYSLFGEQASVSGPVADNMQASLAIDHYAHDGYQHNLVPGVGNPDAANRDTVRAQLRWALTPEMSNTFRFDYMDTEENWANNVLLYPTPYPTIANTIIGNDHEIAINTPPHSVEKVYGLSDEVNWKLDDHLTLKSISAGRTDHSTNLQDGDSTEVNASVSGTSYYLEYTLSQEFNLINDYGRFSGVSGLYYFYEHSRQLGHVYAPGGNLAKPAVTSGTETYQDTLQPTISRAAFAEETYHITPEIGVIAGLRYTEEHKTLDTFNTSLVYDLGAANNGVTAPPSNGVVYPFVADLSRNAHALTPKFEINWQATPGAMIYVSATNGYKSGGYSNTARAVVGAGFGPEFLWAYEAGAKTDWLQHRLRIDVAGFHYDWTGLQFASTVAPDITATSNAGAATLNGLEADVIAKPMSGLTLTANTTLLASRYVSFNAYALPSIIKPFVLADPNFNQAAGTYNASGKELVNAPLVSINLSAQKDFDLGNGADLIVRAQYQFDARTFFDPTNVKIASRPGCSLINASIGYSPPHSHWQVALWGKNLADTQYINGANLGGTLTGPVGDPRTFGLRIDYNY